jgi:hypothetical protein
MRILAALALSTSLLAAGCTTPDGQPDPGATAGLALGLAAIGGLAFLASQGGDGGSRHGGYERRGYERRGYDRYSRR